MTERRLHIGDRVRFYEDPPELAGVIRDIFTVESDLVAEVHCYCCEDVAYFCFLNDLESTDASS